MGKKEGTSKAPSRPSVLVVCAHTETHLDSQTARWPDTHSHSHSHSPSPSPSHAHGLGFGDERMTETRPAGNDSVLPIRKLAHPHLGTRTHTTYTHTLTHSLIHKHANSLQTSDIRHRTLDTRHWTLLIRPPSQPQNKKPNRKS